MAVAAAGLALGWRGVDWPAQLYRVELVHRHGVALWDSQWYGGHWLPDYSVVVAPAAAAVGVDVLTVLAAGVAAACFARLVRPLGAGATPASVVFSLGLAVPVAIGQVTFLVGGAVGLGCLLLASRRRWVPAVALAVLSSLCSPLAGAFVGMAGAALALAWRHDRRARCWGLGVALGALAPVGLLAAAFPGDGAMPYPVIDWVWEAGVAAGAWIAFGRRHPVLRWGAALYLVALTASQLVASSLGGNVGRLEDAVALPLAVGVLWRRKVVMVVLALPLVSSQWAPAWPAMASLPAEAWTHAAYYRPLVRWVRAAGGPPGRIEVVPTAAHYESMYVAPDLALARGWERQLDVADNPIFYRPGALGDASYRAWLLANGVRWVALASAPLDSAGRAEGRLVAAGVPGLIPVWSDAQWRVWSVVGSSGLAPPGVRVLDAVGPRLELVVAHPGPVVIRVRWTPGWRLVAGAATTSEAPGGWLRLDVARPGTVDASVGWPRP